MIGSSMIDRKAESEVEITVIEHAIPSDADLVTAHQTVHGLWIERFPEELEIILLLILSSEFDLKSSQWHIGEGEKMGESDAKARTQFPPIILFEGGLEGR